MSRDLPDPIEYSLAGIRAALDRIADALEQANSEKDGRETARHYARLEENEMRETYGG